MAGYVQAEGQDQECKKSDWSVFERPAEAQVLVEIWMYGYVVVAWAQVEFEKEFVSLVHFGERAEIFVSEMPYVDIFVYVP